MECKKICTSLCVLPPMISAPCISQEAVRNKEEVAKDSTNDPTQVSSSMASFICKEVIFHEDRIQVSFISNVEELSFHSISFSSMSSITNVEDVLLFRDHSERSPEIGFSSYESIGSKGGQR